MSAMGFKLVERVYNLDKDATSPSEQAVLLALAYRANDKTLFCYPKQETLAQMTHLSRATVVNALNALRRNGLIDWRSGGLANKKGKFGKTLSNDYKLNLPDEKSENGDISIKPSVQQLDTPVSNGKTLECLTVRHTSVQQLDTAVSSSKTPTEIYNNNLNINNNHDTNSRRPETGFKSCVVGRNDAKESSPILKALHLCGLSPNTAEYRDNYRAFLSVMSKLGTSRSMDIIDALASEKRQGELESIKNMPAFVMSRLQEFLPMM